MPLSFVAGISKLLGKAGDLAFFSKRNARKALFWFFSPARQRVPRRTHKFSAYLSIYNDWDLLAPALASISNYVDELVVVDGAYEWMTPYLTAIGSDPLRSDDKVYAVLNACGIPYRAINRIWRDEHEKRQAGYEACHNRYVFRIDADEVFFFDDDSLERFLASGCAVADMQMPLYAAPGWIVKVQYLRGLMTRMPSQACLFDRHQVSAAGHLKYLWLVLAGVLPEVKNERGFSVFERPVAFCAHLTHWRTPDTAANRGAFYALNWIRHNHVPWLGAANGSAASSFDELFRRLPASVFRSALSRGKIAIGTYRLSKREILVPTPLAAQQEQTFRFWYDVFLDKLANQNHDATIRTQSLIFGEPLFFDLSTPAAQHLLLADRRAFITTSSPLNVVVANLHTIAMDTRQYANQALSVSINLNEVVIHFPAIPSTHARMRQVLEIVGYSADDRSYCEFIVSKPGSDADPTA